jgi:hypothetical protein
MTNETEHTDAGFTRGMDPQDARRQLHISAAILAVLALAAGLVLATPRYTQIAANPAPVKLTVQAPQLVHVKEARMVRQPGG